MNLKAMEIAQAINEAAERVIQRTLSVEECGEITKALWKSARDLGLAKDVDSILQEISEREMSQAIKSLEQ